MLEAALPQLVGTRERAGLVTEQFIVEEVFIQGCAVEATKGLSRRMLFVWIARATRSLPVPVSPRISTGSSLGANRPINLYTSSIDLLLPRCNSCYMLDGGQESERIWGSNPKPADSYRS